MRHAWIEFRGASRFSILLLLSLPALRSSAQPVLPGLIGWFESPAAETLTLDTTGGTTTVAAWANKVAGASDTVFNDQKNQQPQLVSGGNGANVLRFDGSNDILRNLMFGKTAQELTIFVAAAPTSNPGTYRAFLSGTSPNGDDFASGINIDMGPPGSSQFNRLSIEGAKGGGGAGTDLLNSSGYPFRAFHVLQVSYWNDLTQLHIDGLPQGTRSTNTATVSLAELRVGGRFNINGFPSGEFGNFTGDIGAVLLYDRKLTTAECDQTGAYLAGLFGTAYGPGTASVWNSDVSNAKWVTPENWLGGVPNAPGAEVLFGGRITSSRAVNVDRAFTVGGIKFDNTNTYNLGGTGSITLAVNSGTASVELALGSATISLLLVPTVDTLFTVTPTFSSLAIPNLGTASAGVTLTKAGVGTLEVNRVRADTLVVNQGTLSIMQSGSSSGTSVVKSLQISASAKINLKNNSLIIDYSGPAGTLVDDTRLMLRDGRLYSGSAGTPAGTRLGYADNNVLQRSTFSGQSVDPSSILIKFTYLGDANLDGQVDVTDLGALATNWQTSNVWTGGDFNYDGLVDVTDLGALATNWQAGVGSPLAPSRLDEAMASLGLSPALLPEPAGIFFVGGAIGAATLGARSSVRSRRKRTDSDLTTTP